MTSQVDHILLTRFNLPSEGVESTIRARQGWLEGRVGLFEQYCLPSVRAQSAERSHWIIYFDPDSPDWLKSWIETRRGNLFKPVFRAQVSADALREDLDAAVPTKSRGLITTNLDNDDGLALDFVARLQALTPQQPRSAVYLSRGLIKSPGGLFLRTDKQNAFCSVRESWDEPLTCWSDWHNRLSLHMPTQIVRGQPAWLQVVHDSNVSNRVRGRMVSPRPYLNNFIGLEDLAEPSPQHLWADRLGRMPIRTTKYVTRSSARRVAVSLLGKDGVNKVKMRLARERSTQ